MAENFVKCRCQHCNKSIEFDASKMSSVKSMQVECPHCQLETIIFIPEPARPVHANVKWTPMRLIGLLLASSGVLIVAAYIYLHYKQPETLAWILNYLGEGAWFFARLFFSLLILLIFLMAYFAPAVIAWHYDKRNLKAIFVLNLFLGWTFLFWVLALT